MHLEGTGNVGPWRGATDPRLNELSRMRGWALALLLGAVSAFLIANHMGRHGAWGLVVALTGSAAVGGLADWFAVVALFRRPFGLAIPHTAIIPRKKDRIADNLAHFVRDHFLEPSVLLAKIAAFDPADRLAQWLTDPARMASFLLTVRQIGLEALDWLDDKNLEAALKTFVLDAVTQWDAAQSAGQVLAVLTHDGRHQELFDQTLQNIGDFLARKDMKKTISDLLVKHVRQGYPMMVGILDTFASLESLGDSVAD